MAGAAIRLTISCGAPCSVVLEKITDSREPVWGQLVTKWQGHHSGDNQKQTVLQAGCGVHTLIPVLWRQKPAWSALVF